MTSNARRGFGQKPQRTPEAGPANAPSAAPAAPSARVGAILARHGWLVLAAQVVWLLVIGLHLSSALGPTAPLHHDDLLPVIDVPKDVADDLTAQGYHLSTASEISIQRLLRGVPVDQPPVAGLGPNYFPALGFMVYIEWLGLTAVVAAVRRQWPYYFILMGLMAVPGEPFGFSANMVTPMAGAATVAAIVMTVRRRQFKLMGAAIATFVALILWSGFHLSGDMDTPVIAAPADLGRYDTALASTATRYPAAVAYVRAQAAYTGHDWQRVQTIGPIDGHAFGGTPFKAARLKTLAQTLRDLKRPANAPLELTRLGTGLARLQIALGILALALSLMAWHVHRRSRRVAALEARLLPPRTTPPMPAATA